MKDRNLTPPEKDWCCITPLPSCDSYFSTTVTFLYPLAVVEAFDHIEYKLLKVG